ncbi:MAG: hypothetical protein ABJA62_01040 [Luteimonas sp.]
MRTPLFFVAGLMTSLVCAPSARALPPPSFTPDSVWRQNIRTQRPHHNSRTMISTLAALGGFGFGRMQIDFAMQIVHAPTGAPMRNIIGFPTTPDYYAPDCDAVGTAMPVPTTSAIEGQPGLTCDNNGEDCHLLVVQNNRLYEAYRANASGGSGLQAQCLALWKLDQLYAADNRGEHCTSADAAGFPIAPLLFNADEVYAAMQLSDGDLGHAIRFILPNSRMASRSGGVKVYVRPASHAGGPSGPSNSVPYGSRLRLHANFPVASYPPAARVILRTLQRYGMVLADGGNIALTAEGDRFTTHKWDEVGIDSRTFDQAVPASPVRVQDFDVMDTGPQIVETYDCVRNAEPDATSAPRNLVAHTAPIGQRQLPYVTLTWASGAARVDLYRGTAYAGTVDNLGQYSALSTSAPAAWRVCNADSTVCSASVVPSALQADAARPASARPTAAMRARTSPAADRLGSKGDR